MNQDKNRAAASAVAGTESARRKGTCLLQGALGKTEEHRNSQCHGSLWSKIDCCVLITVDSMFLGSAQPPGLRG